MKKEKTTLSSLKKLKGFYKIEEIENEINQNIEIKRV